MKKALIIFPLIIFTFSSCQENKLADELKKYQIKETQEDKNIELVKKVIRYLDASEYDSLKAIFTEDWKLFWGSSNEPMNFEGFIPLHKMFYTSFPDYTHNFENIIASGDFVVAQFLLTATHKNEFQGIPPTNSKIAYKSIQIYKIIDDKLDAVYTVEDDHTMLKQLGMELQVKEVID